MIRGLSTAIFILLFLGAMFGGLFHMTMGMDMTGNMSGCPFMTHEETLCSMSVTEHLNAWQSAFTMTVPGFALLLSVLAAAVVLVAIAPNLLQRELFAPPTIAKEIVERVYSFSYRPLQELFSSGILHPKLF